MDSSTGSRLAMGLTCADLGLGGGTLACDERCGFDTEGCAGRDLCGNGVIDGEEECDARDLGGRTCATEGDFLGGTLFCDGRCQVDTSGCDRCGDGVVDPGEDCDGEALGGDSCETLAGFGYTGGELGCSADCSFDRGACVRASCNNGTREASEDCDGADLGGRTCANLGYFAGRLACDPTSCTYDVRGCTSCGNGRVDTGESCDAANLDGETCGSLMRGTTGELSCAADCRFDTSGCAVPSCANSPCVYWTRGTTWLNALVDDATHAPASPVVAAFDIEGADVAYVLTETTWHRFVISTRLWIASGPRDAWLPGSAGRSITHAWASAPGRGGDANLMTVAVHYVHIARAPVAIVYEYDIARAALSIVDEVDALDGWDDPNAPDPNTVRAAWFDFDDANGWRFGDSTCPPNAVTAYTGHIGPTNFHVHHGDCFEWFFGAYGSTPPLRCGRRSRPLARPRRVHSRGEPLRLLRPALTRARIDSESVDEGTICLSRTGIREIPGLRLAHTPGRA